MRFLYLENSKINIKFEIPKNTLVCPRFVCLAEVAYVHYMLSFIDMPYLVVGIILCGLSVYWVTREKIVKQ